MPIAVAAIEAGVAVYGAYQQHKAINTAAGQQTAAISKAETINKTANEQNQRTLSPFVGLGTGAADALGQLVLGSHYRPQGQAGADDQASLVPSVVDPGMSRAERDAANKRGGPPMTAEQDATNKMGTSLSAYAGPNPQEAAKVQRGSSYGTVKMQAPNGDIGDIPEDQVEHYRQRGAKVLEMGAA